MKAIVISITFLFCCIVNATEMNASTSLAGIDKAWGDEHLMLVRQARCFSTVDRESFGESEALKLKEIIARDLLSRVRKLSEIKSSHNNPRFDQALINVSGDTDLAVSTLLGGIMANAGYHLDEYISEYDDLSYKEIFAIVWKESNCDTYLQSM